MDAWRVNEQGESLKELHRSERQSGAAARCGMWETIDDALASRRTVPGSLEPFEGEGRMGTVTQGPCMGNDPQARWAGNGLATGDF